MRAAWCGVRADFWMAAVVVVVGKQRDQMYNCTVAFEPLLVGLRLR